MPRIRILPDQVANQIAAGEVVERPAAVVKELLENSLDAGATRIEIEFVHGGRSLMRVEDNGCGMSRDDAQLCLARHATSKIELADDLNRLHSFGFRGEAMPSIASVSRFLLQTREKESDCGTEILVNGGQVLHVRDCGRPAGTRIEVSQLFHPVPARRKFLKTDQTEAAHIIHCVRLYALAAPQVSFTLLEAGRVLFRSPECPRLSDRVGEIFGRQFCPDLLDLDIEDQGMRLHGLIGRPGAVRPTRHEMISFINGRPVDSRAVNYAILESYQEYIVKGRFPMAFLFIELDPALVDVNVHPAKREVRFRNEPMVRGFIIRAILHRLRALGSGPGTEPFSAAVGTYLDGEGHRQAVPLPSAPAPQGRSLAWQAAAPASPLQKPDHAVPEPTASPEPAFIARMQAPSSNTLQAPRLGSWRFIGLLRQSLALFEAPGGLVVLDRRAAQERIWYERLLAQYGRGEIPMQHLLIPSSLELDPVTAAIVIDHLDFVKRHGFELREFGRNFFRIEAVPDWMELGEALDFVRELAGALREGRFTKLDEASRHEEFSRLACTRAVRLPSRVEETAMLRLLGDLFATRSPLSSPLGKPTFFELSDGEMARRLQK